MIFFVTVIVILTIFFVVLSSSSSSQEPAGPGDSGEVHDERRDNVGRSAQSQLAQLRGRGAQHRLQHHRDVDQVHNIVDKACKEMGMEKLLQDLQNVWKELNFDYEDHATGNNDTNLVFLEHCVQETSRLQVDEDK